MPENHKWFLDDRLLQSQKLAAIGELSAGLAHEINNPLAIIRQEAEWMQRILQHKEALTSPALDELKGALDQIVQQVDRCKDITHRLLDFARMREPVIQAVELNKIIEDMALLVEREARHHNIEIIREYDRHLPLIHSDGPQLRQVVLNLLNNATHAINRDGVVTITTRRRDAEAVELRVRDTGCGIPADRVEKIFDPFFTTKPEGQGTGLGLSICLGIIQRLGGRIAVDSAVGQGTTFTISLPLEPKAGG
jgi:two-component system NtrC family sensor kinase